ERERDLGQQERGLEQETERLRLLIDEQNVRLERIAGMTAEEAKTALLANVEEQARHEGSRMAKQIKERAQEGAQKEAREIIGMAIQRYASEHTAETTVSVVQLPNEEMKGRVIGREGRNIRAFEIATGIDVIVDDTPEAVILSGFDRVRREVARIALQRLVEDGRIHPLRIEEAVEKAREELEEDMKRAGEEASFEVGILDLHPEIIKMLGRLRFRTSYGQNVLQHSKEVAILAGLMAQQMGIDVKLACRSGLLHDVGKAIDRESDGTHTELGVELAQRYGEPPQVINAIASHHEDHEATSFYAVLADAADAISSSRPGARRETVDGYVKRLERLEELAQSFNGVDKTYAVQAGREVRVIVDCRTVGDPDAELLATDIAEKIEADMEYPGQIKVVVIRESRAVGIAK
ncbi:MAG: ribonuclease Y, partial [Candidatus Latescibacteria bacterium]|nr:ribonuclease Y [Candidatus Latescibacterota bacterium]